ncbi:hypothetical protein RhiJN_25924 [Ceratobasidium sp. AG-Ba]|nr:hypothetical protein RhiJN_25924 [Ceratobasidium sp. AG-Ba]
MSDSSLPTSTLTATQFCAMIFRQPDFMSAPITRIDWFEKDSWPLYHQYLMFETVYKDQVYDLRVETLGSVDRRNRTALETLALSTLGLGFLGDTKLQVQVSKRDNSMHGPNLLDQVPRANLLLSMSKVDDPLFSQLLCRNEWHFTSVNPGSRLTDRWYGPTLDALCRTLWTILQVAPNYDVENLNCYFVSRTIGITLFGLCPPLPRVTWTLHTQYLYSYTIAEVPWYRLHWRPESQLFATKPSTLNIQGSFMDHVRQIIFYEIRGDRYFYTANKSPIDALDLRYTEFEQHLYFALLVIIVIGAAVVFRSINWLELMIINVVIFGYMYWSRGSRHSSLHLARSHVMEGVGE